MDVTSLCIVLGSVETQALCKYVHEFKKTCLNSGEYVDMHHDTISILQVS